MLSSLGLRLCGSLVFWAFCTLVNHLEPHLHYLESAGVRRIWAKSDVNQGALSASRAAAASAFTDSQGNFPLAALRLPGRGVVLLAPGPYNPLRGIA